MSIDGPAADPDHDEGGAPRSDEPAPSAPEAGAAGPHAQFDVAGDAGAVGEPHEPRRTALASADTVVPSAGAVARADTVVPSTGAVARADTVAPSRAAPGFAATAPTAAKAVVRRRQPLGSGDRGPTVERTVRVVEAAVEEGEWTDERVTEEHPGRYRTIDTLGEGGIGRVLLVQDDHLDREIALKELIEPDAPASEPVGSVGRSSRTRTPRELRFAHEARVTARLAHPGIMPIYELGRRRDGSLYYTMQRVRGRTLTEAMRGLDLDGRLELVPSFVEACQAVAHAHAKGVIHRDLKPSNLMVGELGETVVVDWGLAKVRGERDIKAGELAREMEGWQQAPPSSTVAGLPLGTPGYMPPEQALGELELIDERSDVYSLGAVLFQLLTGQPPFRGRTVLEVIQKVVRESPPDPASIEPDCPAELAAISLRAMAHDPDDRYPSAVELAHDVRAFLTGGLVRAHRYRARDLVIRWLQRNRRRVGLALSLVALAATGWIVRGEEMVRRQAQLELVERSTTAREAVAVADRLLREAATGGTEARWFDAVTFQLLRLEEPATRPALEQRLAAALDSDVPAVRRLGARVLGGWQSREAVPALCARLAPGVEPEQEVVIDVINALGLIGDERADTPVMDARWKAGQFSPLWDQTELAYQRIPMPPVPSGGLSANGWTDRGRAFLNKRNYQAALEAFDEAIRIDPKLSRAYNNRAIVRRSLRDYEGALADYDAAVRLEPDNVKSLGNRAGLRRRQGDLQGALADYDRALSLGKPASYTLRARSLTRMQLGDYDGALADIRQALSIDPKAANNYEYLGRYYRERGDLDRSSAAFSRALELDPTSVTALWGRALASALREDSPAALADLDRALERDPSAQLARALRAVLRLRTGDRQAARSDVEHCVAHRCQPDGQDRPYRLTARAILFHAAVGDWPSALNDLSSAAEITQSSEERLEIGLLAAEVAARAGSPELALDTIAALELDERSSWLEQLGAWLRGQISESDLRTSALESQEQCLLALARGLRAELDGDDAGALEHYRSAMALPHWGFNGCELARVAATSIGGEAE